MPLATTCLVAACLGVWQEPPGAPSKLAEAVLSNVADYQEPKPTPPAPPAIFPAAVPLKATASIPPPPPIVPPGPAAKIRYEIRDIEMGSPDWRGRMLPHLRSIAREEGVSAWTVDEKGMVDLMRIAQSDTRNQVTQAPKMLANLGESVRMSSEESAQYVADLERVADGPPGEATKLAFSPKVDTVHTGVRIEIGSSRLQDGALFGRTLIEQNRLVRFHNVVYPETVVSEKGKDHDPKVVRVSLLDRIRPDAPRDATINATLQVPEVISRRIAGDWPIPYRGGALVVSLGPGVRGEEKGRVVKSTYSEQVIAISAWPEVAPNSR